jgi:hypothetical protein
MRAAGRLADCVNSPEPHTRLSRKQTQSPRSSAFKPAAHGGHDWKAVHEDLENNNEVGLYGGANSTWIGMAEVRFAVCFVVSFVPRAPPLLDVVHAIPFDTLARARAARTLCSIRIRCRTHCFSTLRLSTALRATTTNAGA